MSLLTLVNASEPLSYVGQHSNPPLGPQANVFYPIGGYTVNLTTEGITDWALWALAASLTPSDTKSGGGSTLSLAKVGSATLGGGLDLVTRTISWTDGTPTGSGSTTKSLYMLGLGQGFQLTAPAGQFLSTLVLHTRHYNGRSQLVCSLSDGSAAPLTFLTVDTGEDVAYWADITIQYQAATPGQSLICTWTGYYDDGTANGGHGGLETDFAAAALYTLSGPLSFPVARFSRGKQRGSTIHQSGLPSAFFSR